MATFQCPSECKDLCKTYLPRERLDRYVYLDTLTPAEKDLISKFPDDALMVYKNKIIARAATKRFFGTNSTRDDSDAFRHFIWSGLIAIDLGKEKAMLFLDAHEINSPNTKEESAMDEYNNSMGIKTALELKANDNFSKNRLEKEGLKLLKGRKLKVLSPRKDVPDWRVE